MIEDIVRNYFAKLAQDTAPQLQALTRGQASWRDVYESIVAGQKELISILRRNVDDLDVQKLKNPASLAQVNLGLLSEEPSQSNEPDSSVVFPSAETQQRNAHSAHSSD